LGSEVVFFEIEGRNFKIDVLDVSIVLVVVGLQGNDGSVKHLVAGVGHLGGKKVRSG
jgi:hypothetical protein